MASADGELRKAVDLDHSHGSVNNLCCAHTTNVNDNQSGSTCSLGNCWQVDGRSGIHDNHDHHSSCFVPFHNMQAGAKQESDKGPTDEYVKYSDQGNLGYYNLVFCSNGERSKS